jgi:hypothetical protein
VQLANCVIADNGDDDSNNPTLSLSGGGIWNASGDLTMINCTIARNKTAGTTGAGGGYHHHDFYGGDPDVYIRNTIFWENSVEDGDPEQIALSMFGGHDIVDITNSNVQDGLSGIAGDSPTTYVDNFDEDPLFVNASSGDYRLLYVSPCLNNADPAVLPEDEFDLDEDSDTQEPLPLDLDLNDRQNNPSDCLDIGAYEETTAESCPGDIFDVNGVGPDGEVDQWDLKLVLQKEGTAGGIADVYPWPCGDGIVNDDDADFILQNWGSCGNFNSQLSLPDAIGILVDLLAEYPHLAGPIGSLIQHLLNTWP